MTPERRPSLSGLALLAGGLFLITAGVWMAFGIEAGVIFSGVSLMIIGLIKLAGDLP